MDQNPGDHPINSIWKYPSAWPARESKPDQWVSYAVMDQTWKLVTNQDASYVELYDIGTDLYEKQDLKTRHPTQVGKLLAKLEDWKKTLPAKPAGNVFSTERLLK